MRTITLILATALAVPAFANGVSGTWSVSATDPDGRVHKSEMVIEQEGDALKGVVKTGEQTVPMQNVQVQGDEITFKLPWDDMILTLKLRLTGDEMKGTFMTTEGDGGPVVATRAGGAAAIAGVAGRWKITATSGSGREINAGIELKDEAGKWTGTLTTPDGITLALADIAAGAEDVSFKIPTEQGTFVIKMTLEGGAMKGTYTSPDGASGKLAASR